MWEGLTGLKEQREAGVAWAEWMRRRMLRQGLYCTDGIDLVNGFRFYANYSRKLLILIIGKLMGDILFLAQALDDYIISMIRCFSIYKQWAFGIKLFF